MRSPAIDDDLVPAFVAGDPASLRKVYDEHQRMIYTFCHRAVGDHAADVTQEVFLAAWRSRARFDPKSGSLGGWLMGIARHKVIDHLRTHYRQAAVSTADVDLVGSEAGDHATADPAIDRLAEQTLVADALDRLPEPGRGLIRLAFFDGLSHSEIADRTGVPLGTTKSTIRRGLAKLREHLEGLDAAEL